MTKSHERLLKILESHPQGPKKSLGQNFLISDVVIDRIIEKAKSFEPRKLVEIGPGPGSLTFFLKDLRAEFQLIELDHLWAEHWRAQGLQVVEADALRLDWAKISNSDTLLVSNLPYQISSSLVIDRCLDSQLLSGMVLMFQKEVAQKIRGEVGGDHYGFLSVMAQNFWKIEFVTEAGPRDFLPPPRVASRVLCFTPLEGGHRPQDPERYLKFVKQAFAQRRKTLRSNWENYLNQLRPGYWDEALKLIMSWGFTEKLRAEELSPGQFVKIWSLLRPT